MNLKLMVYTFAVLAAAELTTFGFTVVFAAKGSYWALAFAIATGVVGWPVTEYARLIDATRRSRKATPAVPANASVGNPDAPHTYEADEVADGRTCRICGLLDGGRLHHA
jgi:hypothetical protein